MWFLILMILTTPVLAQEYRKVDDKTIEVSVAPTTVSAERALEQLEDLKKSEAHAINSAAAFRSAIDALENTGINWSDIKRIKTEEQISAAQDFSKI